MGDKEPYDSSDISHGMCRRCLDDYEQKWAEQTLGELLDKFESPVLAVNSEARIVAANCAMAELLQKASREIFGLLGGEAIECQFAQLPDRCGGTIHCKACVIRNTVMYTMKTGKAKKNVPASLDGLTKNVDFVISTRKEENYILLEINEVVAMKEKLRR